MVFLHSTTRESTGTTTAASPHTTHKQKEKQGKGQTHNLAYNPYIALTSLPYAGGHAGLAWGLVLTLASSGLLLALSGALAKLTLSRR